MGTRRISTSCLQVAVREGQDGSQQIDLETALEGKLLLHWGVERQDGNGWALPSEGCRPPDTVAYKNRALQTPWRCGSCMSAVALKALLVHCTATACHLAAGVVYSICCTDPHAGVQLARDQCGMAHALGTVMP